MGTFFNVIKDLFNVLKLKYFFVILQKANKYMCID